jgi:hypothetical protein
LGRSVLAIQIPEGSRKVARGLRPLVSRHLFAAAKGAPRSGCRRLLVPCVTKSAKICECLLHPIRGASFRAGGCVTLPGVCDPWLPSLIPSGSGSSHLLPLTSTLVSAWTSVPIQSNSAVMVLLCKLALNSDDDALRGGPHLAALSVTRQPSLSPLTRNTTSPPRGFVPHQRQP